MNNNEPGNTRVAYFSMEIALDADIPNYSGGLGVLAGACSEPLPISTIRWRE